MKIGGWLDFQKKKRCIIFHYTNLPEIHPQKLTCPLKRNYFSREYVFQPLIFRGKFVSSPGGMNDASLESLDFHPTKTNPPTANSVWSLWVLTAVGFPNGHQGRNVGDLSEELLGMQPLDDCCYRNFGVILIIAEILQTYYIIICIYIYVWFHHIRQIPSKYDLHISLNFQRFQNFVNFKSTQKTELLVLMVFNFVSMER